MCELYQALKYQDLGKYFENIKKISRNQDTLQYLDNIKNIRISRPADTLYIPGGFSTKIIPMLILQAMDQFPKYKQDVCKTITFVSNVDVQAFITHFHNK